MKTSRIVGIGLGMMILVGLLLFPGEGVQSEAAEIKMRTYYIGFLKRGPEWTAERSPEVIKVSQGHRKNIDDLLANGKLALAGPFVTPADEGEGALAGLFLFDVSTEEEALALARADPAVIAGRFTIDVVTWYGPTGITYEGRE